MKAINFYIFEKYNPKKRKWAFCGAPRYPTNMQESKKELRELNCSVRPLEPKYRLVRCVTIQEYYK